MSLSPFSSKLMCPFFIIAAGSPCGIQAAFVPDDHRTGAVIALGDDAFERGVVDRVILDMDGQPLFLRVEARAARHCPAPQHAVMLQPEIVVQPRRVMLLNDENAAGRFRLARRPSCRAVRWWRGNRAWRGIARGWPCLRRFAMLRLGCRRRLARGRFAARRFGLAALPCLAADALPPLSEFRLFFRASNRLTTFDGFGAGAETGAFLPAFLALIRSSSASSYLSSNFDGSNLDLLAVDDVRGKLDHLAVGLDLVDAAQRSRPACAPASRSAAW